jgi:hypothetical protein
MSLGVRQNAARQDVGTAQFEGALSKPTAIAISGQRGNTRQCVRWRLDYDGKSQDVGRLQFTRTMTTRDNDFLPSIATAIVMIPSDDGMHSTVIILSLDSDLFLWSSKYDKEAIFDSGAAGAESCLRRRQRSFIGPYRPRLGHLPIRQSWPRTRLGTCG